MDKIHVIIIGAGNIGARHLQALALSNYPLNIEVVEPHEKAMLRAIMLYHDVLNGHQAKHVVKMSHQISSNKEEVDLAIIATRSDIRATVIEDLLSKNQVKNMILEKVVFSKKEEFTRIGKLFESKKVNAWVNCSRRIYPAYIDLKERISKSKSAELTVEGMNWNMAANTIHFMDLFAFLFDLDVVKLEESNLIDQDIEDNFIVFFGTLEGKGGEHLFEFSCIDGEETNHTIDIVCEDVIYGIDEEKKTMSISKEADGWASDDFDFDVPFQSQLTNLILTDLIENNTCGLTTFKESTKLHLAYFDGLGFSVEDKNYYF
ncbi:MAG: Gfo/Idh/MocA family oxidoreductase [Flavobacteriales bacterium]|nr:Gfo/Idh/MocA family oxidoreductase [Flavobacteriales bacterium]